MNRRHLISAITLTTIASGCGAASRMGVAADGEQCVAVESDTASRDPETIVADRPAARAYLEELRTSDSSLHKIFVSSERDKARAHRLRTECSGLGERLVEAEAVVAREWMSELWLGAALRLRFAEAPPVGLYDPELLLDGTYLEDTNIYLVNPHHHIYSQSGGEPVPVQPVERADLLVAVAHEQHHYAAQLGGEGGVRWQRGSEVVDVSDGAYFFSEGVTELLALRLARRHGQMPTAASYRHETAVAYLVEGLLGQEEGSSDSGLDTLRHAYLSGDYSGVRAVVDGRLGPGTFAELVTMDTRLEWDLAICFITRRMAARGIPYRSWARGDPLAATLRRQLWGEPTEERWFSPEGEARVCRPF